MGTSRRKAAPTIPIENLFTDHRFAGLWAVVRVLLGWAWLQTGWRMAQDAAWMNGDRLSCAMQPGVATVKPIAWLLACQGGSPSWLLGAASVWGARVAAIAAMLLGIAVILGFLTGPALLLGGLVVLVAMPPPAAAGALLQLAAIAGLLATRRSAGWIGLDRWLLPLLSWRSRRERRPPQ